ncbi:MAG: hypothetical protein ACOCWO_01305 [Candidatus Muiribacteriaceae bacterium]
MKQDIVLLPSQSKTLIGKAIWQRKSIERCMSEKRKIVICRGTTNSYLLEEFQKAPLEKERFTTGVVMPGGKYWIDNQKISEKVIDCGILKDFDFEKDMSTLESGDIVLKGANSINYAKSTAGILILNKAGGTLNHIFEAVFGRRVRLIVPAGLEKEVSFDLDEMSEMMGEADCTAETPRLFSIRTDLFTEIEAISVLTEGKVEAYHIATGGIKGAQGAVRLLLDGDKEEVERIVEFTKKLPINDIFT